MDTLNLPTPFPAVSLQDRSRLPEVSGADAVTWIDPNLPCEIVYHIFSAYPDLPGLAVLEDDLPIGLVDRSDFLLNMGWQYGWSLYAKQAIRRLMDPNPLMVEDGTDARTTLVELLAGESRNVRQGYLVVTKGRFLRMETTNDLLRRIVEHMHSENHRLRDETAKSHAANRTKSRFLASMSHELRTPLNAIIGFSQMITDHQAHRLTGQQIADYAGDVVESGEMLLSLINDILDLAKLEAGKMEASPTLSDSRRLLESCIRLMKPDAAKREVSIGTETLDGMIYADPRQASQIIVNLLSNAVKFTSFGGSVTVTGRLADDVFAVTVADQGPGIPDADLERIFRPFEQAETKTDHKPDGTGLGLAIVGHLAVINGASISVANGADGGAVFTVAFQTHRAGFDAATATP